MRSLPPSRNWRGKNWGGRGMKLPFNAFPMKHLGKPRKFPFRGCPEDVCSPQPATTILTQSLPNPNLSNSWGHPLWFGQKRSWGMGNNWERKLSFSHQVTYQGMNAAPWCKTRWDRKWQEQERSGEYFETISSSRRMQWRKILSPWETAQPLLT